MREEFAKMIRLKILFCILIYFACVLGNSYAGNSKTTYVMIGDSITAYGAWQNLLTTDDIVNRGVAGDTTGAAIQRMSGIVSFHPKRAFIMLGINDIGKNINVDIILKNYEQIVSILQSYSIDVIVFSTLQCNIFQGSKDHTYMNTQVFLLNTRLKQLCDDRHIKYVDVDFVLSDQYGLKSQYTTDGVHLNIDGYRQWSAMIFPLIN